MLRPPICGFPFACRLGHGTASGEPEREDGISNCGGSVNGRIKWMHCGEGPKSARARTLSPASRSGRTEMAFSRRAL
jgi:hypothetical protein